MEPGTTIHVVAFGNNYPLTVDRTEDATVYFKEGGSMTYTADRGWKVDDYPVEHEIGVPIPPTLGVYDVDILILLNMDYENLVNLCSTNKYHRSICDDEGFWNEKIKKDFDLDFKGGEEKYRWIYYKVNSKKPTLLINSYEYPDNRYFNVITEKEFYLVPFLLDRLHATHVYLQEAPDEQILYLLHKGMVVNYKILSSLTQPKSIKYIYDTTGILPSNSHGNNVETYEFLLSKNITPNYSRASTNHEVIRWMTNHDFEFDMITIFQWLEERQYFVTPYGYSLKRMSIPKPNRTIDDCIIEGDFEYASRLFDRGQIPSANVVHRSLYLHVKPETHKYSRLKFKDEHTATS